MTKKCLDVLYDMLNLEDVTLVAASDNKVEETLYAVKRSCEKITFGEVIFFGEPKQVSKVAGKLGIKNISYKEYIFGSSKRYNKFCIKELSKYINTSHYLIIQHDGFVINPQAWDDEFLEYDYIGSPWNDGNAKLADIDEKYKVGNGGFSLRSKRLGDVCLNYPFDEYETRRLYDLYKT